MEALQRRLVYFLPLSVFLILAVYFAIGLTKDPSALPSVLINKPAPDFNLAPIKGRPGKGFSSNDLKKGEVSVVNVFASWCLPCRTEHALITRLAKMKIARVYGLNYKDKPESALRWLQELGDPYAAIGTDPKGRVAIYFGVYGIPETFIIDATGTIRYKLVGPITQEILNSTIVPIIKNISQ
jgi:cytochrome c biogenesis protein CcmG/thiol:disulfide interchange protein DsbE